MTLFEDDIREFNQEEDIDIIEIKCKLLELHLKGHIPSYLMGFVDCIALMQIITCGEWDDLKEYVSTIQACN